MFLTFPAKTIRASIIKEYCQNAKIPGVVCFTCGHAAKELRRVGMHVVEVGPHGSLMPAKWWSPAEIAMVWPHLFDATSGHLPMPMMMDIALAFKNVLGELDGRRHFVATGSGETIVCLGAAYPHIKFVAVYNAWPGADYNREAPLNRLVVANFESYRLDKYLE